MKREDKMKRENLQKMADLIKKIHPKNFNMWYYRIGEHQSMECGSVGCVIGHSTILDDPKNIPFDSEGDIEFGKWSEKFTGFKWQSPKWLWCFSPDWKRTDNTPEGASKRIEYLLNNGLPENWCDQMSGITPLSYS